MNRKSNVSTSGVREKLFNTYIEHYHKSERKISEAGKISEQETKKERLNVL